MTDPWEVSEVEFPEHGSPDQRLIHLLNYAVLAPSSHNSQPWLFKMHHDTVELHADRSRALPVVDPEDRELTISCGAALHHLCVAMRHFGSQDLVTRLPDPRDPDYLALVRLGERHVPTEDETALFHAVHCRRTNRHRFDDRPVPPATLMRLQAVAAAHGIHFSVVEGEQKRMRVAELIAEADRVQSSDRRFRRELAMWVHPSRTRSRDGLPGYAIGVGEVASYLGPFLIRTFDQGEGRAARDRDLALGSPVLAVMWSDEDLPGAWLQTGEALSHVALQVTTEGLGLSFLDQPIEVHALRGSVQALVGEHGFPQVLVRIGFGPEVEKPTPRRPVREVLV